MTGVEKPAIVAVVVASVSGCESREATSFAQLSQAAFDAQNTRVDLVEGLGFNTLLDPSFQNAQERAL